MSVKVEPSSKTSVSTDKPSSERLEPSPPPDSSKSPEPGEPAAPIVPPPQRINLRAYQPYIAGYAKSRFSGCRLCLKDIPKGQLRLGRLVTNRLFPRATPAWFHFECFFNTFYPRSTGDFTYFTELRYTDQKKIQAKIDNPPPRKFDATAFLVAYAKTRGSACLWCERKIPRYELRIGRMDDVSDIPLLIGAPVPRWFHVDCFVRVREKLGFAKSADYIPGFEYLKPGDQEMLMSKLPELPVKTKEIYNPVPFVAKSPQESESPSLDAAKLDEELEKQSDMLYVFLKQIGKLRTKVIDKLLRFNNYKPPRDYDRERKIYLLTDAMAFGALEKCPKCRGQVKYRIGGFICVNVRCDFETELPKRVPFKVPEKFKDKNAFLKNYKYIPRTRIIPRTQFPWESYYPVDGKYPTAASRLRLLLIGIHDDAYFGSSRTNMSSPFERELGKGRQQPRRRSISPRREIKRRREESEIEKASISSTGVDGKSSEDKKPKDPNLLEGPGSRGSSRGSRGRRTRRKGRGSRSGRRSKRGRKSGRTRTRSKSELSKTDASSSDRRQSISSVRSLHVDAVPINLRAWQPYIADYAKSSASHCGSCDQEIHRRALRIARLVTNLQFQGQTPIWFHFGCFFDKFNPRSTGDIANFTQLRYEDQKKIQSRINVPPEKKFPETLFVTSYALSSRSHCLWCEEEIPKGTVRVGRIDDISDIPLQIGEPVPRWFHIDCFSKCRRYLGFAKSADVLTGFEALDKVHQEELKKLLPELPVVPKPALDPENFEADGQPKESTLDQSKSAADSKGATGQPGQTSVEDERLEEALKKQSDLLYSYIPEIQRLRTESLEKLLRANGYQIIDHNRSDIIFTLVDAMAFGALEKCPKCHKGQLGFRIAGYICYAPKCNYETEKPPRKPFVVPNEMKNRFKFLADYKYTPKTRIMPKTQYPYESYYPSNELPDPAGAERIRLLLMGVIRGTPRSAARERRKIRLSTRVKLRSRGKRRGRGRGRSRSKQSATASPIGPPISNPGSGSESGGIGGTASPPTKSETSTTDSTASLDSQGRKTSPDSSPQSESPTQSSPERRKSI